MGIESTASVAAASHRTAQASAAENVHLDGRDLRRNAGNDTNCECRNCARAKCGVAADSNQLENMVPLTERCTVNSERLLRQYVVPTDA